MKRFSEYRKDLIGESSKVYKALSPKMKKAVDELFKSADKLDKMDTLILRVAKKYGVKVSAINDYLDKETLR
jgi:hypothetical protein